MVDIHKLVDDTIRHNNVAIFTSNDGDSEKTREFIREVGGSYFEIRVDQFERPDDLWNWLYELTGEYSISAVFACQDYIGGYQQLVDAYDQCKLRGPLRNN